MESYWEKGNKGQYKTFPAITQLGVSVPGLKLGVLKRQSKSSEITIHVELAC